MQIKVLGGLRVTDFYYNVHPIGKESEVQGG